MKIINVQTVADFQSLISSIQNDCLFTMPHFTSNRIPPYKPFPTIFRVPPPPDKLPETEGEPIRYGEMGRSSRGREAASSLYHLAPKTSVVHPLNSPHQDEQKKKLKRKHQSAKVTDRKKLEQSNYPGKRFVPGPRCTLTSTPLSLQDRKWQREEEQVRV